jgi:hypothetical protein
MSKTPAKKESGIGEESGGSFAERLASLTPDDLRRIIETNIPTMTDGLMNHSLKVLSKDESSGEFPGHDERDFIAAAMIEIKPRDAVERMLSVQMAATHVALIRSGRWLANAQTMDQVKAHCSGYNKLCRTFTAQMEALRKHRNGGKQTVTVQHVNVEDGGQAIVGSVHTGGRGEDEK